MRFVHHIEDQHPNTEHFYVVTVLSNIVRFESRWRLYKDFAEHMRQSGAKLITVELAYGDREFEVTEPNNDYHVQLRCRADSEIWHKENLVNEGIARAYQIDPEVFGVGWVDADIRFGLMEPMRDGVAAWINETCHQLEHYAVVQMWSNAIDLGPNQEIMSTAKSFGSQYLNGIAIPENKSYGYWHSGYAWAARSYALDLLCGAVGQGPLLSFAPLGSADFYMAWAMIGQLEGHLYQDVKSKDHRERGFTQQYIDWLMSWQYRAANLKRNIGCVNQQLTHFFHGNKIDRGYNTRENILIDGKFNPLTDIRFNRNGIMELVVQEPRQLTMRDQIRAYLRSRNEDSVDLK
jgi:hypothetical protein